MKTYGTLRFDGVSKVWDLQVEPHVSLKLKRVFPQVKPHRKGALTLVNTAEVARDLEWFLHRYPLELDDAAQELLRGGAQKHREKETLVARLLAGLEQPRPVNLALPPRQYQLVAAELWMQLGKLLLADELGLGKTVTTITALANPDLRPALVVAPTHLCRQWAAEFAKFAPGLRVHVIKKGKPYDIGAEMSGRLASKLRNSAQVEIPGASPRSFPDVVICNYHKLAGWPETLAPFLKSVVFDECQELRNGQETQKGAAAARLSEVSLYSLGLSATPIYNLGSEFFAVCDIIAPGHLGNRDEFLTAWCSAPDQRGRATIVEPKAFGTYLRDSGVLLRRTKADVGMELPPIIKVPHEVDCDDTTLKNVESAAERLAEVILHQTETRRGEKRDAALELDAMIRHATGVAKAPYVAEFVKMIAADEKVVLFGWHHDCYRIWMERLKDLNPVLYTGQQSAAQKEESLKKFVEGDSRVFIMSLRAGLGLNGLQTVSRIGVFGELDWSPGVMEQCGGRLDRDGQNQQVILYYMLANEGSDPIVADILNLKRDQVEGIKNPHGDELLEQLEANPDRIKELARSYLKKRKDDAQTDGGAR